MTDLEKVQADWREIARIETPSEEVQLAAVQQNGDAIRLIKNPSEEIKLIAALSKDYND